MQEQPDLFGKASGSNDGQKGQPRLCLREIVARSYWRAARSCYSLTPKFPRGDLKLGGLLREPAVGTKKRIAPKPAAGEGSQYLHRYDAHGGYYDPVRLKTNISGKTTKQPRRKTQINLSTSCLLDTAPLKTERPFSECLYLRVTTCLGNRCEGSD